MTFFLNPKRRRRRTFASKVRYTIQRPLVSLMLWCGFPNVEYSYVHGDRNRLVLGERVSTVNTLFNTNSGDITVGDDTVFGHDCMVLAGVHRFSEGRRASLTGTPGFLETPPTGYDIRIGKGCFLGSGSIVLGGVTIGDDVIVGAGAVVTRDVPSGVFVAGNPARVVRSLRDAEGDSPAPGADDGQDRTEAGRG